MIVAILFADRLAPLIDGRAPYFLPFGEETLIERAASTVLRGPFGGTIVATASAHIKEMKSVLSGFAVQHLSVNASARTPHANNIAAIRAALEFRARWQKAMAAAAARFANTDDDDEDDDETDEPRKARKPAAAGKASKKTDWAAHSKSPDVKIRGLARSFDRDGILFLRGERPLFKPDLQAQLVEAFGREGSDRKDAARPFAQAVFEGQRGYPILMSIEAAQEVAALPPETNFDQWLLQNLERVQDVKVADRAAIDCIESAEDYERLKRG